MHNFTIPEIVTAPKVNEVNNYLFHGPKTQQDASEIWTLGIVKPQVSRAINTPRNDR